MTEGKQFSIRCWAEPPISWFKDGEPIEKHFVRHNGLDEFTYTTRDHVRDDLIGKVESTLSVSHAVLRHKGKYQCNVNHNNAHVLNVHPAMRSALESDESFDAFEAENDHEEQRMRFEGPLENDKTVASTMMIYTSAVTETPRETPKVEPSDIESILDYDEEKSHEKFIDEPTTFDGFDSSDYESTVQALATSTKMTTSSTTTTMFTMTTTSTTISPSLTNFPLHPTHANHVVHTTHEIPSEVKTQNHPEKHRHKGSQK